MAFKTAIAVDLIEVTFWAPSRIEMFPVASAD